MTMKNGGFEPVEPKDGPVRQDTRMECSSTPVGGSSLLQDKSGGIRTGSSRKPFEGQLKQALLNVLAVVEEAGGSAADIGSMTIYVTDKHEYLSDLRAVGAIWKETIGRHYPAMALVEVAALVEDQAKLKFRPLPASERGKNEPSGSNTPHSRRGTF